MRFNCCPEVECRECLTFYRSRLGTTSPSPGSALLTSPSDSGPTSGRNNRFTSGTNRAPLVPPDTARCTQLSPVPRPRAQWAVAPGCRLVAAVSARLAIMGPPPRPVSVGHSVSAPGIRSERWSHDLVLPARRAAILRFGARKSGGATPG